MSCRIRCASVDDAAQILEIYAPIVAATHTSFEYEPPSVDEMRRRIGAVLSDRPWLVCEDGGRVLGYAYATRWRDRSAYQWTVETAVYVRADDHGRGIGEALYTSLFECLRRQGFHTATAGITIPNPASVRLHEKLGFRPVGVFRAVGFKLNGWRDVAWYQLELNPAEAPPGSLRSAAEVLNSASYLELLARAYAAVRP